MPESFRMSYLLPFYKNKGDTRKCDNYRGIKLMSHTMKIYERIINTRIRNIIKIHDDQCGFISGKSTTDAIQTTRILIEKHRDAKKDLHMVFIDLEKAFDRVPRSLIWAALRYHDIPEVYVLTIQDMYENVETKVKCTSGTSQNFPVKVGVHQGSVLSPLLFILVMNYLTSHEMDSVLKTMLFADDVVLISDNHCELQNTLERWRKILEENGLKISRKKTEYLYLPFENPDAQTPQILLDGEVLVNCDSFKYLGSLIHKDGSCAADVNHRIGVGWMKFRSVTGVLCDPKIPIKLKGKVYQTVVRPAIMYGSECWTMYNSYTRQLETAEMRMLRWSAGVSLQDRIKSSRIRGNLGVTDIHSKLKNAS
jgi:hypothetical protein